MSRLWTRDRLLIERFETWIGGFNRRSIHFEELLTLCEDNKIDVVLREMPEVHGLAFQVEDQRYIYINRLLSMPMRVFTLSHEFCHAVDQALDTAVFKSTGKLWLKSKAERAANVVGAITLMPSCEIAEMNARQIADYYGIPLKLAEFRLGLEI